MYDIPKVMRGIYLLGHGDVDQLVYCDTIPTPSPGSFDVLIKIGAAGVNNTDLNTRKAWYAKSDDPKGNDALTGETLRFPRIQGIDVCGTVVAVGEKADTSLLYKRVLVEPCLKEKNGQTLKTPIYLGLECDGGFADYVVVPARHAHPIQSTLTDIELASFPCSYSTAENLLSRAQVQSGEVVCVTGASGGVGSAVIQLAKARKATVIALTSPTKFAFLKKLGADKVLSKDADLRKELGENSVDVVIDVVAGHQWSNLLHILKPFGRFAVSGAIAGPTVVLDVRMLYLKDLQLLGCTVIDVSIFKNLIKRIENKEIMPLIDKTFPLHEIHAAQQYFETKQHIGKIILTMDAIAV